MSTDSNTTTYDGDVTLTGAESEPITVHAPEDAFFRSHSVDGAVTIPNAEYVFTHAPTGGSDGATDDTAGTTVQGSLEDLYVKDGVAGDVHVGGVEDVFIPAETATGSLHVTGAENIYAGETDLPTDPTAYDVQTTGWHQRDSATDPSIGAYLVGIGHDITLTDVQQDITLYVVGYNHSVTVDGRGGTVSVEFLGYDNHVDVGARLEAETAETGFDNGVTVEDFPAADLIETTKADAFGELWFGRSKATYQQPAEGKDWCPNCGVSASAIIERHYLDAFFIAGRPVKTYDENTEPAYECEHCSRNAPEATLTEDERRRALR